MQYLPVIVAMGGINAAGRTSGHHAYKRLVVDHLSQADAQSTWQSLSALMHTDDLQACRNGTLIRAIESNHMSVDGIDYHRATEFGQGSSFVLKRKQLPDPLPETWQVETIDKDSVRVHLTANAAFMVPNKRVLPVQSAAQLPSGFSPKALYPSRNHPRGLQMTVYGASDAVQSMGLDWEYVCSRLQPDQIAVYAGSALSQLDYDGFGGLLQARLLGKRVTSKQLPLGFADMPAAFINAYLLGNVGATGCNLGACATFLYNLQAAQQDINSGRRKLVIVGNSEAPIRSEIIDGFATMGALATVEGLRALDGLGAGDTPNFSRACRPFGDNCGFTLGESAQFVVLMSDDLALEMGADILGAVGDVFVHADGYKKSIASPGVGNYISLAKTLASVRNIFGAGSLKNSFVQAHGTGTPFNRITESYLLNQCARTFGIQNWPVTAIKAHIGHSISAAAGDQLAASLGVWQYGIIPGINTIDAVADDVEQSHLNILKKAEKIDAEHMDTAIINAKGFGGNNASAAILAPHKVKQMLRKRHGEKSLQVWQQRHEAVQEKQQAYEDSCLQGKMRPIYRFGEQVLEAQDIDLSASEMHIPNKEQTIPLHWPNPYADMCED